MQWSAQPRADHASERLVQQQDLVAEIYGLLSGRASGIHALRISKKSHWVAHRVHQQAPLANASSIAVGSNSNDIY